MFAKERISPVWFHVTDRVMTHGEGIYVWDTDGNRYIDFTSGIGVTNTGHSHPRVVKAIQDQAAKFIHAQVNIYYHEPLFDAVKSLQKVVPAPLDTFYFSNSGAEAVEAAVKLARYASHKPNIIVFQGGFHGRTAQAMAMTTSKTSYRKHYQPLPGGVFVAPFPYWYRYGWEPEVASQWTLQELRTMLKAQTDPSETAAIIIEPVLGEGGYVVPPASFLQGLRQICNDNDILLVLDEIQSGFGRTGKFFAMEHFGVVPDILIMAKGLASGFPISAIAASEVLMAKWTTGAHGGTYGGNILGCAAAAATIETLLDEKLVENAAARGQQLMDGLVELQSSIPVLGDVRGLGLMVGVEMTDPKTHQPDAAFAKQVISGSLEHGNMILMSCGTDSNTVRWIPPLVVSEQQIDEGLHIFRQAAEEAYTSRKKS